MRCYQPSEDCVKKPHLTVLSITHDLEEALLADRIFVMNNGHKYAEGTPAEDFCAWR